jgi:DNA-binding NarL/FixJ family response regulator
MLASVRTLLPLAASHTETPSRRSNPLTRREVEVAALVAEGATNRKIGEALTITEGTAELHVVHILTKLGFDKRAQITAWYVAETSPAQVR